MIFDIPGRAAEKVCNLAGREPTFDEGKNSELRIRKWKIAAHKSQHVFYMVRIDQSFLHFCHRQIDGTKMQKG